MQFFPTGKVFDFMGRRRLFMVVSILLVVASGVGLFKPGPRLGTDFQGGTEIEVAFDQPTTPEEIRQAVRASGFSRPDVIRVNDEKFPHRFLIRVEEVSSVDAAKRAAIAQALCVAEAGSVPAGCPAGTEATEFKVSPGGDKVSVRYRDAPDLAWVAERMASVDGVSLREGDNNPTLQNARDNKVEIQLKSKGDQLLDGLKEKLGTDKVPETALRVEWIGPKAGAQLRDAALKSIAIALVFIMAYIAVRFDLRFAPGAVVALVHDALLTVGVLIALQKEVNLTTVAAILTIVGYSVNDTVVVYDRVRENLGKLRGSTFINIINISLSEMLSRTMLTSMTTVLSLVAFFVFGTGTLKDFSLTLIIGIMLGTYSSIYIALPLTEWLDRRVFGGTGTGGGSSAKRAPVRKKVEAVV